MVWPLEALPFVVPVSIFSRALTDELLLIREAIIEIETRPVVNQPVTNVCQRISLRFIACTSGSYLLHFGSGFTGS